MHGLNQHTISNVFVLTIMFALTPSLLTHSVPNYTHHHTCSWVLTPSLTHYTHHHVCPHPVTHSTCVCTHHHGSSCLLAHSVVPVPALTIIFCPLSPTHFLRNYTHHRVWLTLPLTHSLCLWLNSPPYMFVLVLSPTRFVCDYTHHYTCVHYQGVIAWGDRCFVCGEIGRDKNKCVHTTDVWYI